MKIQVWQHVPFEGSAFIADWARRRGLGVACRRTWGDRLNLPDADTRLLVVMGGPMSVHDEAEHPWLIDEKQRLREVIDTGLPVLGVCLGAQLLAQVLGAAVTRNPQREIGWFPVQRDDASLGEGWLKDLWPPQLTALHWHGETFAIPPGARRIARSAACANQGFIYDQRVIGLQCHLETTSASLRAIADHCPQELAEGGDWVQTREALEAGLPQAAAMHAVLETLLDHLLERRFY